MAVPVFVTRSPRIRDLHRVGLLRAAREGARYLIEYRRAGRTEEDAASRAAWRLIDRLSPRSRGLFIDGWGTQM